MEKNSGFCMIDLSNLLKSLNKDLFSKSVPHFGSRLKGKVKIRDSAYDSTAFSETVFKAQEKALLCLAD
jgi:hypothetical protein